MLFPHSFPRLLDSFRLLQAHIIHLTSSVCVSAILNALCLHTAGLGLIIYGLFAVLCGLSARVFPTPPPSGAKHIPIHRHSQSSPPGSQPPAFHDGTPPTLPDSAVAIDMAQLPRDNPSPRDTPALPNQAHPHDAAGGHALPSDAVPIDIPASGASRPPIDSDTSLPATAVPNHTVSPVDEPALPASQFFLRSPSTTPRSAAANQSASSSPPGVKLTMR
jgi:hypothetical protein